MKEPKAMKEIHAIRLKLYEEWRRMSHDEMVRSVKENSAKAEKELRKYTKKN